MKHPGVAYVIAALFALMLVVSLSSCGVDAATYENDCLAQDGKIVKIESRSSCVVDGAVVAEWYSE